MPEKDNDTCSSFRISYCLSPSSTHLSPSPGNLPEPESTCFLRRGQRHHSSKLPFLAPQVICKEAQPHTHSGLTSGRSESSLLITYPVRGSSRSFSPSWVLTAALVQDLRGARHHSGHFPCIISYSPQPSSDGVCHSFPFC